MLIFRGVSYHNIGTSVTSAGLDAQISVGIGSGVTGVI